MDLFGGLMKRHGYTVSYAKKIDMPGNCMESNQGENAERLELEDSRVEVFAKNINRRFVSTVENFDSPENTAEGTKARFAGSPFVDFHADPEKCIGCGICAQVCPMNNIQLVDGLPQLGCECAFCFGCFHWCPKNAMSREGLTRSQYHHPEVSLADMEEQGKRL